MATKPNTPDEVAVPEIAPCLTLEGLEELRKIYQEQMIEAHKTVAACHGAIQAIEGLLNAAYPPIRLATDEELEKTGNAE